MDAAEAQNGHQPLYDGQDAMPPSLAKAIDAFILACAIRSQRGQANEHSSMLIHVTRFTAVQRAVHHQVEEYIRHLRQRLLRRIDHEPILVAIENALGGRLQTYDRAQIRAIVSRSRHFP